MPLSSESKASKIGFFGGTFDPPHNGHLTLVRMALDKFNLDQLLISPTFITPLRDNSTFFHHQQRLEMARRLANLHPKANIFDYEISNERLSYTYETVLEVRRKFPDSDIHLLIGFDQFAKLSKWKFLAELSEEVHFLVFARDQTQPPRPPEISIRYSLIKNPLIDISSSVIKSRMRDGKSIKELVPPTIFSYLQSITQSIH